MRTMYTSSAVTSAVKTNQIAWDDIVNSLTTDWTYTFPHPNTLTYEQEIDCAGLVHNTIDAIRGIGGDTHWEYITDCSDSLYGAPVYYGDTKVRLVVHKSEDEEDTSDVDVRGFLTECMEE